MIGVEFFSTSFINPDMNKLVLTQSSARFLFLSCAQCLFLSFGAKWQEDREDLCSSESQN